MSIIDRKQQNERSAISRIGSVVLGVVKAPFNFASGVIKMPFDLVGSSLTKVVIVAGLAIVGIYFIGKFKILKDIK